MRAKGLAVRSQRGFTLAELAIALVIVALLLASALIPLSAQIELKSVADTKKTMDQIQESLLGFAIANGRLPCPADGSIADGSSTAGQEIASCDNSSATKLSYGVVPWATLGVPATDAWGRRFSYRVAPVFADSIGTTFTTTAISDFNSRSSLSSAAQATTCTPSPTPTQSSIALCTVGNLSVYTRSDSTRTASSVATYVAAVVISHGKNGYGAVSYTHLRAHETILLSLRIRRYRHMDSSSLARLPNAHCGEAALRCVRFSASRYAYLLS